MKKIALISGVGFLAPFLAFAQPVVAGPGTTIESANVTGFFTSIQTIISAALPLIISIAVLLFLWGLVRYMTNADDPEARASARGLMIWGIVIIFVMISVWGLVNFLGDVFGLTNTAGTAPAAPLPATLPGAAAP